MAIAFLSTKACAESALSAQVEDGAFLTDGYARIVLKAKFDSAAARTLRWTVLSADNMAEAVMPGFRSRTSGLSWNRPCVANGSPVATLQTESSEASAQTSLFDVLGERCLTIRLDTEGENGSKSWLVKACTGPGPIEKFGSSPKFGKEVVDKIGMAM